MRAVATAAASVLLTGCGTAASVTAGARTHPGASNDLGMAGAKGSLLAPGPGGAAGSPAPGPSAAAHLTCAQVAASHGVEFARISGRVVALPPDNPVARDGTIVQPENVPLGQFAVGVDDGSGAVCPVAWMLPGPRPAQGATVHLVVQIVPSSGGGHWLGPVDVP